MATYADFLRRLSWNGAAAALAVLLAACSDSPSAPAPVTSVDVYVVPGGIAWLAARARADLGGSIGTANASNGSPITYASTDPTVARVDSLGRVFGLIIGKATISATLDGRSKSYSVVVKTVEFASVFAGGIDAVCGVTAQHEMLCWGSFPWAIGVQTDFMPFCTSRGCYWGSEGVQVPTLAFANTNGVRLSQLALGLSGSCAIDDAGATYCWGSEYNALSATAELTSPPCDTITGACQVGPRPVSSAPPMLRVAVGADGACGISTSYGAYCWGADDSGELGSSSATKLNAATAVAAPSLVTSMSNPGLATCWIVDDQRAWCTGNPAGFGNGPTSSTAFTSGIAASGAHFKLLTGSVSYVSPLCGILIDGRTVCWKMNEYPREPASSPQFMSVQVAPSFGCGLTAAGELYCWGANYAGQLGNGSTDNAVVASLVAGGHKFTAFSVGDLHVCAMGTDGLAYCWGNLPFDLGQTDRRYVTVPKPLPGQG